MMRRMSTAARAAEPNPVRKGRRVIAKVRFLVMVAGPFMIAGLPCLARVAGNKTRRGRETPVEIEERTALVKALVDVVERARVDDRRIGSHGERRELLARAVGNPSVRTNAVQPLCELLDVGDRTG